MATKQLKNILYYIKAILKSQDIFNFSNIASCVNQWDLTRTFSKTIPFQKRLWDFFTPLFDLTGAYLIIDDTILEKPYSKVSRVIGSFIRWVYSHKHNRSIKGIQVVFLLLVVGNLRFPIGFKIYDKSRTKIQLAIDLLSYARNTLKLKSVFVLFDSWYSSKKLLKIIKDYGWYFVCRIKRNRKVNGIKVKHMFSNPYGKDIPTRGVINNMSVLLIRNRKHYIITNRLSLNKDEILKWYENRSIIEEFFKVIKSRFKAKYCQSRIEQVWENHLFIVLFCFILVELRRIKLNISIYKAKSNLRLKDYTSLIDKWKRFLAKA